MARAMLSEPAILVADEPTQGVDVGARAEIYRILREVAARGVPVVVASSDTKELEGLCDRVIVMSRGQAVATLEGDAVTEERIVHAAISATRHTAEQAARAPSGLSRLARFIEGDYAPVVVLAVVIAVLGAYVLHHNTRYLSDYNINTVMFACAALGFISLGQTFALLLGGIDLSVGPLAGFLVVLASFFVLDGHSPAFWALGFALMFASAVGVGLLNGALIRFANFTPVAATLVTYIGLGGLSFTLRVAPDGYIATSVTNVISTKVGPVPIAFVVFVLTALVLELGLRRTRFGMRLRAVGSDEESARRVGVPVNSTALLGYLGASLLTLLGAIVLLAQLGVGDPGQGTGYTLTSITAVVLGGTSLLGGRGTFIGTLMGAGLSVQVLNATVFLSLDQKWQYIFQGLLIVAGALIYSQVRRGGSAARGAVMSGRALVIGVTGISGGNVAQRLLADGWQVSGVCRNPQGLDERITPLAADLEDAEAVVAAVRGSAPTHVFFTTWSRRATEAENCDVNGRMLQNLLDAIATEKSVRHVALVTGLKHYLGPFEAYAKAQPDTPFSEDQARLPYENFYYVQEDILFAAAERDGFTWSVHRPHTLIGWALGNAMNMGVTLAVYAAICRETGRGFQFPGLTGAVGGGHRRDRRRPARRPSRLGGDDAGRREPGPQHRQRRRLPLAANVAAARCRARRRADSVRRSAGAARAADGRRERGLARDRAPSRPARPERREPRLVVAHGRRSGPHDRDVHRHGPQQAARLPRHSRQRVLVHRSLRAPAGRADRATSHERGGPNESASFPCRTRPPGRGCPRAERARSDPGRRRPSLDRDLRHRPPRVRRRPDRHPG